MQIHLASSTVLQVAIGAAVSGVSMEVFRAQHTVSRKVRDEATNEVGKTTWQLLRGLKSLHCRFQSSGSHSEVLSRCSQALQSRNVWALACSTSSEPGNASPRHRSQRRTSAEAKGAVRHQHSNSAEVRRTQSAIHDLLSEPAQWRSKNRPCKATYNGRERDSSCRFLLSADNQIVVALRRTSRSRRQRTSSQFNQVPRTSCARRSNGKECRIARGERLVRTQRCAFGRSFLIQAFLCWNAWERVCDELNPPRSTSHRGLRLVFDSDAPTTGADSESWVSSRESDWEEEKRRRLRERWSTTLFERTHGSRRLSRSGQPRSSPFHLRARGKCDAVSFAHSEGPSQSGDESCTARSNHNQGARKCGQPTLGSCVRCSHERCFTDPSEED